MNLFTFLYNLCIESEVKYSNCHLHQVFHMIVSRATYAQCVLLGAAFQKQASFFYSFALVAKL